LNQYQVYVYKGELNRSVNITVPNGVRSGRTDAAVHSLADAIEADLVDLAEYEGATPWRTVQYVSDVVTTEDVQRV
jgi:tRNA U38,U39,U40 pseudouridine synthase TruA